MFSGHKADRKNKSCEGWKSSWPQNHTAPEPGRHLWKSPKLYSEQAQLNQVAQGHVHSGSEHHQWWSLHHIYAQYALVSDCPHSVIKKSGFLQLQPQVLPLALSLTIPRGICLSPLHRESPNPSLLCTHSPSLLSLSSFNRRWMVDDGGGPWLDSLQSIHVSS